MKRYFMWILPVILLSFKSSICFSQDFLLINKSLFEKSETIPFIKSRKLIDRHYLFSKKQKEIAIYVIRLVDGKRMHQFIGYCNLYYRNGIMKDSSYFDLNSNLVGIGKGYYRNGKLNFIGLSRDISIEEGLHYSKNRVAISDSYEIYFYKNGNRRQEFGAIVPNNKSYGVFTICNICYNKDGTIKKSIFYSDH